MTKRKTASGQTEQHRNPDVIGLDLGLSGLREAERNGRLTRPGPLLSRAQEAFRHHTYFSDRAKKLGCRAGNALYIE